MNTNEQNTVLQAWNGCLSIYGRQPVTDPIAGGFILNALSNYQVNEIVQAISEYVNTENSFAPTPSKIKELIEKKRGEGAEVLALKAEAVYREMSQNCNSANDWIVADPRAAVAIKDIFLSPQYFAKKKTDERTEQKQHLDFIKRYQSVTANEIVNAQQAFGGFYMNSDDPIVSFLGDYQICLKIVAKEYQGRHPRLPQDPSKRKQLTFSQPKIRTPEERLALEKVNNDLMKKALGLLNNCFVRKNR